MSEPVEIKAASTQVEQLAQEESLRINRLAQVEMRWWPDKTVTDTATQLTDFPEEGRFYRLIGILRDGKQPRSARPEVLQFVNQILTTWSIEAQQEGLDPSMVLLSITSLYRDTQLQEDLRRSTPNAVRGSSSHETGFAIDFDPRGYYDSSTRKPVQANSMQFDNRYTKILRDVLEDMQDRGLCNFIPEHRYKDNETGTSRYESCYHVCISPEFVEYIHERNS